MSFFNKMTPLHIHLAGFFTALIVAGALYFLVIKPKQENLQEIQRATNDLLVNQHGEEDTKHKGDLAAKQREKIQTEENWKVASADYMPAIDFGPDVITGYQKLIQVPTIWGTWVTAFYDAQKKYGVTRTPGVEFPIPSYPTDPNTVSTLTSLTFPRAGGSWPVTLECKSFDDLIAHLRRFNSEMKGHGMPVIDNVALSGQSPNLVASYNLAMYVILPNKPPAADPRIGAGNAAGGGAPGGNMGSSMGPYGSAMMGRMGGAGGGPRMGGSMAPVGGGGPSSAGGGPGRKGGED